MEQAMTRKKGSAAPVRLEDDDADAGAGNEDEAVTAASFMQSAKSGRWSSRKVLVWWEPKLKEKREDANGCDTELDDGKALQQ